MSGIDLTPKETNHKPPRTVAVSLVVALLAGCSGQTLQLEPWDDPDDTPNGGSSWAFLTEGSNVTAVAEDSDILWIGTDAGLVRLDRATGEKSFFGPGNSGLPELEVLALAIDHSGALWTATPSSLNRFDGESWERFRSDEVGLQSFGLAEMKASGQSDLVVADAHAVVRYSHIEGTWSTLYTVDEGRIGGIAVETSGAIWVAERAVQTSGWFGTPLEFSDGALTLLDGGDFETVLPLSTADVDLSPAGEVVYLSAEPEVPSVSKLKSTGPQVIAADVGYGWRSLLTEQPDSVWLVGSAQSAKIVDGAVHLLDPPGDSVENWLRHVSEDGTLWSATESGLFERASNTWELVPTSGSKLPTNNIADVAIDSEGTVWLATAGRGLLRFDSELTELSTETSNIPDDYLDAVAVDAQDNVWFTTVWGHLSRFDGDSFDTWQMDHIPERSGIETALDVSCPGSVWIGTVNGGEGGLYHFDGNQWDYYGHQQLPTNHSIIDLQCDANERVWFGTLYGDVGWRNPNGSFGNYTYDQSSAPSNPIQDIQLAPGGNGLWVAHLSVSKGGLTRNDGTSWHTMDLSAFEVSTESTTVKGPYVLGLNNQGSLYFVMAGRLGMVSEGGLATPVSELDGLWGVRAMASDPNGNMWFATDRGVAIFNEDGVADVSPLIEIPHSR